MDPSTPKAVNNKLTATFENFDDWIFSIENLLIDCDLWNFCTKELNTDDPNEKEKDAKAKAKIVNACDVSVIPIIRSAKTAYETLNRLKAHAHGGLKKRLGLMKTLLSNKYNGNMKEYVDNVLATKRNLQEIGAPVDDGFLAMFLLAGLPEALQDVVRTLDNPGVQITLEVVVEALQNGHFAVPGSSGTQQTTPQPQPPNTTCETCGQKFKSIMGLKRHHTISSSKGGCASSNASESPASASTPKRAKLSSSSQPSPARTPTTPRAAPVLKQTHTIRSLAPFTNPWTIKAVVIEKSDIQSFKKKKKHGGGQGSYFTMDLRDRSGFIRAVAFGDEAERLYDVIQVDKEYFISRGTVQKTKKKYKQLENDNEIKFTSNTVVAECVED